MSEDFFLAYAAPIMFLLAGISLLTGAAYYWSRTRALLANARDAVGEVIAIEKIPPQQPGSDEYESYAPVVAFRNSSGHNVQFTSLSSSYPTTYSVGDRVPVLYVIDGSEQPRIRSFHDLWFLPLLLGALGLIFTAVGVCLTGGVPE